MHRRIIKGVLHNFIGTYTSRYSDYDGYWLFGMVVRDVAELRIDLLYPNVNATAPRLWESQSSLPHTSFESRWTKRV